MHKVIAKGKQLKHYKLTFLPYKGDLSSSGTVYLAVILVLQGTYYSFQIKITFDTKLFLETHA